MYMKLYTHATCAIMLQLLCNYVRNNVLMSNDVLTSDQWTSGNSKLILILNSLLIQFKLFNLRPIIC
jgi:hypothetical protein